MSAFFRKICSLLFVCIFAAATTNAQTFYGTDDVKIFRDGRDKEFRNEKESALTEEDFLRFKGLNYFPNTRNYRVKADFKKTADEKYFQMPTSSGKVKKFRKFGIASFKLNGKNYSLSVYQADAEALKKFPEYSTLR